MTIWDRHLCPPDDPEAKFCKYCGQERELHQDFGGTRFYEECSNPFCPDKHEGVAKEMAEEILDLEDEIHRLKRVIKKLEQK